MDHELRSASRAELSPGAVYCWFPSKEAIIDAVAEERHRQGFILQQAWEPDLDITSYRHAVDLVIDTIAPTPP
ncbi:TetR/AcrR family transcriptional regulator [Nocardia terpenica]|uniref:TetR family transcriptional regulator n=1 Tax=Nocardia terpenica TaxID=455432 RepID=A0A6G9YVK6_9NOCA|nr:TetR/AcrR family transcriptional regulator [Nocardia terpenica]QIS17157.1 hypothetical protein F6W96_01320 [Nocardia terpenica]